jgi:hypothetical protein
MKPEHPDGSHCIRKLASVYGEQGLRARFSVEVTPPPRGPDGPEKASQPLELAARLRTADRRQREPYLNHPLRVTLRIECHYGDNDLEVICGTAAQRRRRPPGPPFGRWAGRRTGRTRRAVQSPRRGLGRFGLHPVSDPAADEHAQYRAHVAASLAGSPWTRVTKASNFTTNGVLALELRWQRPLLG